MTAGSGVRITEGNDSGRRAAVTVRPCSLIFVLCVVLRWRDDTDISHLNVWLKKGPAQFYIFMARVRFFNGHGRTLEED